MSLQEKLVSGTVVGLNMTSNWAGGAKNFFTEVPCLLTAKVNMLIKKVQVAKNHWNLQTEREGSSIFLFVASKLTIEIGMTTRDTMRSLNPMFTMKLFPNEMRYVIFWLMMFDEKLSWGVVQMEKKSLNKYY